MAGLRLIAACPHCGRQSDASELAPGSRFRCSCGDLVSVPEPRSHEAAVVRCSSCGAPREGEAPACGFCGADFTLHERDLDTICPGCCARVSGRARFCHHCATALIVEQKAGEPTEHPCPLCGPDRCLASRRLGEAGVCALECGGCGGLFLGNDAFRLVADRALGEVVPTREHAVALPPPPRRPQRGPLYRPCPRCGARMNRQNYGRSSGVIVDLCRRHGVWLDAEELDRIVAWIRGGGPRREDERRGVELAEAEQALRARQLTSELTRPPAAEAHSNTWEFLDYLVDLVAGAARLFSGLRR
jgi:Zn-finger nucleic acid-binding protein